MGLHQFGQPKVTQLDSVITSQEDYGNRLASSLRMVAALVKLTIFRLEIAMQDHDLRLLPLETLLLWDRSQDVRSHRWRVDSIVAAIQSGHQLGQNTPNKLLFRIFVRGLEVLDDHAQVTAPAVFHVEIQVLRGLEVFSVVVGDDVGVSQGTQDIEFGRELFPFFLGHLDVVDFLPAENLDPVLATCIQLERVVSYKSI